MTTVGVNKHEIIVFDTEPIFNTAYEAFIENNTVLQHICPVIILNFGKDIPS